MARKHPEVYGVPTRITFNVKCPKCGKYHEESVRLMMAGRPSAGKGAFYFLSSPFDSFCGGKDDFK
jgi:hypothetical protein